MALTVVQDKYAAEVDGVVVYFVRTAITNPGPLADTGALLMAVTDPADSALDVLQRTSTVIDFGTYLPSRIDAVERGDNFYRTAENIASYTTIDTAAAGAVTSMEELDALLADWNTYYTGFSAIGQSTEFPLADPTILSSLVTIYQGALATTATAAADNTAAQTDLTTSRATYDSAVGAQQTIADAASAVNSLLLQVSPLSDGVGSLNTFLTFVGTTPPSGFGASTGEGTAFMMDLNNFLATFKATMISMQSELAGAADVPTLQGYADTLWDNLGNTGAYTTLLASGHSPSALAATADNIRSTTLTPANTAKAEVVDTSSIAAAVTTADSDVSAAGAALVSATSGAVEKEAAYVKAQTDEATALAAVVAVDPTYTP